MNFNKTSNPKVDFHKHNKCWRIRVRYYARTWEKGKNMDAYGYPAEEEAKNDVENFRMSLENNETWIPYNKRVHVAVDDNSSSKKKERTRGTNAF
jgi:hypothetical protein